MRNRWFALLQKSVYAFRSPVPAILFLLLCTCSDSTKVGVVRKGIITMAPHLTETVFALGQGQRVIAVGSFDDYPPETAALPKVGGYIDPNLEKIAALSPELLIVPGRDQKVTEFAMLKGLTVLQVNMDSLATIDGGIATIGKALGCEAAATALRERLRANLEAIRGAVKGLPRTKVLIITERQDHTLNKLYTANRNSFVSEIVNCAGGDNIFADAPATYLAASKETVVVKAPDAILEFHAGEKLDESEQARYKADWRQLPSLPAVQSGRIFLILESHATRPGPRVAEIALEIARLLHPDAPALPTSITARPASAGS
jgi:iron complex transport system substrate-binding protein